MSPAKVKKLSNITIGVVGLGEMGAVIAAQLLAGGHKVAVLAPGDEEFCTAKKRVNGLLKILEDAGELLPSRKKLLQRFQVAQEYSVLRDCRLVIESIIEDLEIKRSIIARIEEQVGASTIIGTNTSTLSVTNLQEGATDPTRVLGLHWLSSSPFATCVEVMPGAQTSAEVVEKTTAFVRGWGMEPIVARHDAPGFLGNRIYYAMLREAFHIVDSGIATPEEVDLALRGSMGTWLPYAGLFGYLDLNGLQAYPAATANIFPHLSTATGAPESLLKLTDDGARGVSNGRGFYNYTPAQAKKRQREFENFRRDVTKLMQEYSQTPTTSKKKLKKKASTRKKQKSAE